jgi:hypothetical protein
MISYVSHFILTFQTQLEMTEEFIDSEEKIEREITMVCFISLRFLRLILIFAGNP